MPDERSHHSSKKRRYSIVLVSGEDSTAAKSYHFTPGRVVAAVSLSVLFIVGSVLVLILYTRVGHYLPISNPELESKYSKDIVALYQQMVQMKEQLVELSAYNVKLRKALGENATLTDSGVVKVERTARDEKKDPQVTAQVQKAAKLFEEQARAFSSDQIAVKAIDATKARVTFPAILPTQGYVTRGFDPSQRHFGLDIAGKVGTVVNAAADGYIVFSGWSNDDGYLVIISHENGFLTFYKHNQSLLKSANTLVKRGEPIALLGNSGKMSSAPHLHFEIWKNGVPVDPALFMLNLNL